MREVAGNPTAAGSALTPNVEINGSVATNVDETDADSRT
jgi:hypothetical protein